MRMINIPRRRKRRSVDKSHFTKCSQTSKYTSSRHWHEHGQGPTTMSPGGTKYTEPFSTTGSLVQCTLYIIVIRMNIFVVIGGTWSSGPPSFKYISCWDETQKCFGILDWNKSLNQVNLPRQSHRNGHVTYRTQSFCSMKIGLRSKRSRQWGPSAKLDVSCSSIGCYMFLK